MSDSPFQIFSSWLFDGDLQSEIPNKDVLLKYNSPITETYVIGLFKKCGKLNFFLNKYLNNIGLRYLEKEDLFKFIKKTVIDFKINRYQIYFSWPKRKDKLFEALKNKMYFLKPDDADLLCKIIEKSEDREQIYASFGIGKPVKEKVKRKKTNSQKNEVVSLKKFLQDTFIITELEAAN